MRLLPLVVAIVTILVTRSGAQLSPPDAQGLSMGHVLLNVTDVKAHVQFWTTCFDASPIRVGTIEGVAIPGVVVLFRPQLPSGPSEGSTINHLGLKLQNLESFTRRFDAQRFKYDPPRVGRENTPQTYVTGPDGFRMELVEDPKIPAPVVAHHLHYWLERPQDVKAWYVRKLRLAPTQRGPYPSGDLPGMNLTFAPLGTQKGPGVPTRGRLLDSIGFDVRDLRAYASSLSAEGVEVTSGYARDRELGLMSVIVTDPWGATIRLTEGLAALSGTTPFAHVDGFVVARPLD